MSKKLKKLREDVEELKPLRSRFHCQATGCDGCTVCKKETEVQMQTETETQKFTDAQIDRAVAWWVSKLRKPTFKAQSPGEFDPSMAFSEYMASELAQGNLPTEEQLEKFGSALKVSLGQSTTSSGMCAGLWVDYGPDKLLFDCAVKAGIKNTGIVFPWKTGMNIYLDGTIKARCGYAADWEDV